MLTRTTTSLATAVTLAILAAAPEAEAATRARYQCSAVGTTDISMTARYEVRTGTALVRRTFTTEFEAAPGTGFAAGRKLAVVVKGVRVGVMTLEPLVGGDVVGDINFDTRPQLDSKPFPANWPAGVGRGTTVKIMTGTRQVLGCTLR